MIETESLAPWQKDQRSGRQVPLGELFRQIDGRYITNTDVTTEPGHWIESPRPRFDEDGGCHVPGLGYRRWTFAEHEAYAVTVHDRHRPVITSRFPWCRATCSGCPGRAGFASCPHARWAQSIRTLLGLLRGSTMLLASHPEPAPATPHDTPVGRHIDYRLLVPGTLGPTELSVYCDGSIRDTNHQPQILTAEQLRVDIRDVLRRHHPIGCPLQLSRSWPWLTVNEQRICYGCATTNGNGNSWQVGWCEAREWALAWRQAPAWLLACIGMPCTAWPRPVDPQIAAHTSHCTADQPTRTPAAPVTVTLRSTR
ncbi:hypothetical protein AB0M47_27460 [Hamadaea sp. NPDC051192]|uniref:hypothetical protein n=1 Tax=Hamadaea sp. NPDC051192 TaxID=3154940 RepID=UPI003445491B